MKPLFRFFKRSTFLFALLLLPGLLPASTYSNMVFLVELCDASGNLIPTSGSSGYTICKGSTIYVKNKSKYGCSGTTGIGGPGLQGQINITYVSGSSTISLTPTYYSVTNAPGGTWNYNELLAVPINVTTSLSWHYFYCEYWAAPGEVTYASCTFDPTEDFLCYGRVANLPSITATATPSAICAGQSSVLTASDGTSSGSSFTWTPGGMTGTPVTVTPAATTTYNVTATSVYGCVASKTVTVTVNNPPVVHMVNYTLCASDPMPVLNAGMGAASYYWTYNGSFAGSGQYMFTAIHGYGTYQVTVTGANGCSTTATSIVQLDPSATPDATFTYSYSGVPGGTQVSVAGNPSNTYNTWSLYNSDASGAQVSMISSIGFTGGLGSSYTFPSPLPENYWYRIDHTVSKTPCLASANAYRFFYISSVRRLGNFNTSDQQGAPAVIDFVSYPNPTSGQFSIRVNASLDGEAMQFAVYDLMGRQVGNVLECKPGAELQVDLGAQPKGIYMLRATSQDQTLTTKIVVE